MNKKTVQEVEEIDFNFPSVKINGVEGVTIKAKNLEEALEKLKKL